MNDKTHKHRSEVNWCKTRYNKRRASKANRRAAKGRCRSYLGR